MDWIAILFGMESKADLLLNMIADPALKLDLSQGK
jgi:hypothetical protein